MSVVEKMEKTRIVPVIALENEGDAVNLCKALEKGGLEVAEITFRTKAAAEAMRIVSREFPAFMLGAGTVTTVDELELAKESGAQFAVAPGLNSRIVEKSKELDIPFFPGVCTPSDIETALELDCQVLKFFPAEASGGVEMIKALYGPYRHRGIRFIPTGGVGPGNLATYLSQPGVLAVGGTWIVSKDLLGAQAWDEITALTKKAVSIAQS